MKCKYCNSELRRGAKFCSNCGKEVSDIIYKEETVYITEPQKDNVADTLEPYESVRSSKKWIWILGVVLLLCIVGGGWLFLNDGHFGNEVAAPTEEEVDSIAEVADSIGADIHSVEGVKMRLDEIFRNGLNMQEEKAVKTYFTQEFRELFDKVSEYDNTHDFEGPGFWQGNIWDGGQDGNPNLFKIINLNSVSDTKACAAIKLIYEHGDYHSENLINADLAFENGNWFVDNIGGQKEGMKEYVSQSTNGTNYNGTFSMIGHVSQDDIHMKIEIDNSSVQGRYYYDSRGSSNKVRLEGMIDVNGNMKLIMFGNDGETKGYFIGAFDGSTYSGQFIHNSIEENLQFSVSVE